MVPDMPLKMFLTPNITQFVVLVLNMPFPSVDHVDHYVSAEKTICT
jgi:hypothetical protein